MRRGWSLLELVLVIAIIALLGALLAPSLTRVRGSARAARTLSYLHGHGAVLAAYASDWHDSHPAFFDPRAKVNIIRRVSGKIDTYDRYFMAGTAWHFALSDGYYNRNLTSCYPAEQTARDGVGGPPFQMSCTVFARPKYWRVETRDVSQLGPTRTTDVAFPSRKTLLMSMFYLAKANIDASTPRDRPVPMLACDGSAQDLHLSSYAPGVQNGDGPGLQPAFHFGDYWPGLHTLDGIAGRDVP